MEPRPQEAEDDDILELDEDQIIDDAEEPEQQEPEPEDGTFHGFDEEPEAAPVENDLVKHLRQQIRDRDRQLAQTKAPAEPDIVVGPRPKAADFDYDDDALEAALDAYEARKVAADKQATKRQQQEQAQQDQWTKVTQDYATKKAALRFPDVQETEQVVLDTLSPAAQAVIAKHAKNSAFFIYALGKSAVKLDEMARIDAEGDPIAIGLAIGRMEAMLQKPRTNARPPAPDTPVRGKPISASGTDKHLAKLEKEAERSGDRTEIAAYRRKMGSK